VLRQSAELVVTDVSGARRRLAELDHERLHCRCQLDTHRLHGG
jgi:hypothetical protein